NAVVALSRGHIHRPSVSHMFFFLARQALPRGLHSFPTRRSSDLNASPYRQEFPIPRNCPGNGHTGKGERNVRHPEGRQHWGHQEDRKSTRLNSSHVKISYADFCLKKKHTNPSQEHSPEHPTPSYF